MKWNELHPSHMTRRDVLASSVRIMAGAAALTTAVPVLAQEAPTSAGAVDPNLLEDVVAANRILYQEGIVDAFGHVSVRHNRSPERFLLAASVAPELITADDLIEYDLDCNPVDLEGRSQVLERFIHGEIYKARPDVNSVVHNHSPTMVAFGISSEPLRPVFHMGGFIGGGIPIFDIRIAIGATDMLVRDHERGHALARALGDAPAVFMRGHGVAAVGPSLPFSVGRSIYLETNARIQADAVALGGDVTYLDPQEAEAAMQTVEGTQYQRPWEMWKRKAMGE